jgi:hypothetical protein
MPTDTPSDEDPSTAAERAALAAERAAAAERIADMQIDNESSQPDEAADKTDMSAVGDDGQVFGG